MPIAHAIGFIVLAYCLFPAASLFNHSCAPNMELQRNGRAYTFHAKEDVALGAELNVTYLGQNVSQLGFRERQDRLLVSDIVSQSTARLVIPLVWLGFYMLVLSMHKRGCRSIIRAIESCYNFIHAIFLSFE